MVFELALEVFRSEFQLVGIRDISIGDSQLQLVDQIAMRDELRESMGSNDQAF